MYILLVKEKLGIIKQKECLQRGKVKGERFFSTCFCVNYVRKQYQAEKSIKE